jgi:hypothetical protein
MNLNNRITRLEQTLASRPCKCPDCADLSWPGHQPNSHCPRCGGQRLIYPLTHHPRAAEPLLRDALPILAKSYNGRERADLSKLTDPELQQLKQALQAAEDTTGSSR